MIVKHIRISTDSEAMLSIYLHQTSSELPLLNKRPAILIFPGGGYQFCSDREAEPVALSFMQQGYNAFVLRYSLKEKSKYPRPLKEAEDALEYILQNYEEFHIDREKVATIGFSAGGHLSAMLATKGRVRPKAQILIYPALIRDKANGWDYPTPTVDEKTPETFIAHTYFDGLVPLESPMYFLQELHQRNIPCEFHLFRNGVHGLSLSNELVQTDYHKPDKDFAKWFELAIAWLKHTL